MRLLVILVAWVLRRQLDARNRIDPEQWQRRLLHRAPGDSAGGQPGPFWRIVLIYVVAVLAVGALVFWGAESIFGGLWASLLALVLMLVATGMPGWRQPMNAYAEAWRKGDMQAAWYQIQHLLPAEQRGASLEPDTLHLNLAGSFINACFERYFLPIFWYAVLGPAGLVLILGGLAIRDHYPSMLIRERFALWVDLLAWIPARLLSFTFAIAGDFAGWAAEEGRDYRLTPEARRQLLTRAASGALSSYALDPRRFERHHPDEWPDFGYRSLLAVRQLLNRGMVVWIAALAVLAIMGWLP